MKIDLPKNADNKHYFAALAAESDLTGEQAKVLFRLLASEYDGVIGIWQKEIAKELEMTESNVSRSIHVLIEKGLIVKSPNRGHDGCTIFNIRKWRYPAKLAPSDYKDGDYIPSAIPCEHLNLRIGHKQCHQCGRWV